MDTTPMHTIQGAQQVIDRIEVVTGGRFRSFQITNDLTDPIRGLIFATPIDATAFYLGLLSVAGMNTNNEIRKGPFADWYSNLSDYHFKGMYHEGLSLGLTHYA